MISIKSIVLLGLVSCFLVVGCGQKQEPGQSEKAVTQSEQVTSQIKDTITKQAEDISTKGSEIIGKAKSEAELMKEKTEATVKELIAKANSLLGQGKFNEAIVPAQSVLTNYDSDSEEAKGIIAKAKEKLKAMAEAVAEKAKEQLGTSVKEGTHEELEATSTEKVKDIKDSISDKLKGFGE
ncbi:MAG: hypothetical protein GY777_28950 [Candidatus Brocadiaceae bacterium]|nr:hypothetical protein [Candidatus Brocadiaceae bacterium]